MLMHLPVALKSRLCSLKAEKAQGFWVEKV